MTKQQNEFKIKLKELEDSLLSRLSSAGGNYSSRPSPSHQPPTEAIEVLEALASPDGDREDVDETVVVYLMADILDRIETNVSMEFSMV